MNSLLEGYGKFVARRPYLVLSACLLILLLGMGGSVLIRQSTVDFSEQVPDYIESIQAFSFIEDEFGGTGLSVIYAVEIDPDYPGSSESRDVRDPEIIAYLDLLGNKARTIESVTDVRSAADILMQSNGGTLPKSKETITGLIRAGQSGSGRNPYSAYISPDYSIAVVRVSYDAQNDEESEGVVNELLQIADETSRPLGIKTTLTGGPVTNIVIFRQIGPTFALTGSLSFIGIFMVVVLIFYSLRYGLTSLLAIAFGSVWAFGFLGFSGLSLNPQTSGALSLILGIGIDFGIQVVTRFRQELRKASPREATSRTLPRVIAPMTISMLAIILGFTALSFGELKFVGELGNIMAIGVFMSYLAAITVVPSVLLVLSTFSLKNLGRVK
jgi:predicted RND superfamily exporter protein